jgi:ribosome-binding protein aMBF1 (putative translation factor)
VPHRRERKPIRIINSRFWCNLCQRRVAKEIVFDGISIALCQQCREYLVKKILTDDYQESKVTVVTNVKREK